MSSFNCFFLTCIQVSQEACQVVWYSHLSQNFPQFIVIHTVKGFGIVNKAEIDVFPELSCVFNDPVDVGNLISGSSAFSKSSFHIWKFSVHVLLKPSLENFEHYFASVWDECSCAVVWTFFALPFFGIGVKTDLFQSCGPGWVFQICWHIECSTLPASSFRTENCSTEIPSALLASFIVELPKVRLTSRSRMWLFLSGHTIHGGQAKAPAYCFQSKLLLRKDRRPGNNPPVCRLQFMRKMIFEICIILSVTVRVEIFWS